MKVNKFFFLIFVSFLYMCVMHHAQCDEYYTIYTNDNNQNEMNKAMVSKVKNAQFHNETYLSVVFYDTETKRYGFFNKNSNTYQPAIYYRIYDLFCRDASYPMLVETEPDCYVYIDRITGSILLNGQYRLFGKESEFRNGFALICILTENPDYPSLIDIDGNITSFPDSIIPAGSVQDNGLLIVCTIDEYGDALYGICRSSGEIVLEPQFDYIAEYHNGFASVRLDDLWGHIDENGIICIYPCYELSEEYENGYTFNDSGIAAFELLNGETITLSQKNNIVHK